MPCLFVGFVVKIDCVDIYPAFCFRGFYGRETGTRVDKVSSKALLIFLLLPVLLFLSSKGATGNPELIQAFKNGWKWAVRQRPPRPLCELADFWRPHSGTPMRRRLEAASQHHRGWWRILDRNNMRAARNNRTIAQSPGRPPTSVFQTISTEYRFPIPAANATVKP